MKPLMVAILLGVTMMTPVSPLARQTGPQPHNHSSGREQFSVMFPDLVRLQGALLKGSYIIIHDEEQMARGKDCLYVYASVKGEPGKLVTSYRCEPVERARTDQFLITLSGSNAYLVPEVREIQFPGSTKGHRVPS
ncbi:MAG TPA: hypothetical protein VNQ79_12610 [Blastocatellia bacterium]|nr:hypothetical protein [Blastocatellia bacterium]